MDKNDFLKSCRDKAVFAHFAEVERSVRTGELSLEDIESAAREEQARGSLEALMYLASHNLAGAFDKVYKLRKDWLYRIARASLRPPLADDAEDLVQITFVRAYLSRARFIPRENLRSGARGSSVEVWLKTILRNLIIERIRKKRPTVPLQPDPDENGNIPYPGVLFEISLDTHLEAYRRLVIRLIVDDCYARLREEENFVIERNIVGAETIQAIVPLFIERFGMGSLGTISNFLRSGLDKLRRCVESKL